MEIQGVIKDYDGEFLTIVAPFDNTSALEQKCITDCEIRLNDGRSISNKQRRKIFALVNDIGTYISGISNKREYQEELRLMKLLYIIDKSDNEALRRQLTLNYCECLDIDVFSLSDTDMTTAKDFISWLIELCINHDIPTNDSLLNITEDIDRYLYLCCAKRRCAVCGKKADIHHVDTVGSGINRKTTHHLGKEVQPLCRLHHTEAHKIGKTDFNNKYHLTSVKLDEYLCKVLGLKK